MVVVGCGASERAAAQFARKTDSKAEVALLSTEKYRMC
jgi:hypothetical protein